MKKFLFGVVALLIFFAGSVNVNAQENFAEEVLALVNVERAKVGARPLVLVEDLQRSAAIRAHELLQDFSHTRPDGSDCFTAMERHGRSCGENIAAGQATPEAVVDSWMNSDGHRENILNPEYREMGIGYVYSEDSHYNHYWVQLFRSR